jgi:hypothetical protein
MRINVFRRTPPEQPPPSSCADDAGEEDRLSTAVVAGDIPSIWYRQRMTALAALHDPKDRRPQ